MDNLVYGQKKSRKINLKISPQADFREILQALEALALPDFVSNEQNIKYAVLELVNNSLRAHREKKVEREIVATFTVEPDRLKISVKDFGGGFNPNSLPYKLNEDHSRIDPRNSQFLAYQQKNNYLRFGMGLLLAKKTFPHFELVFFDAQGKPVPWESGRVSGTLINLSIGAYGHGQ